MLTASNDTMTGAVVSGITVEFYLSHARRMVDEVAGHDWVLQIGSRRQVGRAKPTNRPCPGDGGDPRASWNWLFGPWCTDCDAARADVSGV